MNHCSYACENGWNLIISMTKFFKELGIEMAAYGTVFITKFSKIGQLFRS
jgi:hypothetical protein